MVGELPTMVFPAFADWRRQWVFLGASISESQPFGLISILRLALIRGVSDGTKVSGSDDKTS